MSTHTESIQVYRMFIIAVLLTGFSHPPAGWAASLADERSSVATIEALVLDTADQPIEGSQSVWVRFFEDSDAAEPVYEIMAVTSLEAEEPAAVPFVDGRFRAILVPELSSGEMLSVTELFDRVPGPWVSLQLDDHWETDRRRVGIDRGRIRVLPGIDERSETFLLHSLISLAGDRANEAVEASDSAMSHDPASYTEPEISLCSWRITCQSTRIQIRWGVDGPGCFASAEAEMPMAIVLRGNGYSYRDYDYLQNHLGRNGILSISVDAVADPSTPQRHQAVADRVEDVLTSSCLKTQFLDRFVTPQPINFHRTAVIGHSRGGESARFVTNNLYRNWRFSVRSVVAMAPTRDTSARILGNQVPAYMLLHDSADSDVIAPKAFKAHDFSGWNELGTPSYWDLDRSMKLLGGGSHQGFSDKDGLAAAQQRRLARGYVNAFLRAWLKRDWQFYEAYVRGDSVPGPWSTGVTSQYSDGRLRRAIDNFQNLTLETNNLGGPVWTSRMKFAANLEADSIPETPHAGRLLKFEPERAHAYVAWGIPTAFRDARPYRYVSFRLGRLTGQGPIQGRLWIQNGSSYSRVDLSAYGEIPQPRQMCVRSGAGICLEFAAQGHMRTFRVPLSDLGAHNNVSRVYLQITSGAIGDSLIMDNLEFSSP